MKVTVNFHNHQLKEVAQEGAPKVDRVPDKFCISHSVELAILKPPRFNKLQAHSPSQRLLLVSHSQNFE